MGHAPQKPCGIMGQHSRRRVGAVGQDLLILAMGHFGPPGKNGWFGPCSCFTPVCILTGQRTLTEHTLFGRKWKDDKRTTFDGGRLREDGFASIYQETATIKFLSFQTCLPLFFGCISGAKLKQLFVHVGNKYKHKYTKTWNRLRGLMNREEIEIEMLISFRNRTPYTTHKAPALHKKITTITVDGRCSIGIKRQDRALLLRQSSAMQSNGLSAGRMEPAPETCLATVDCRVPFIKCHLFMPFPSRGNTVQKKSTKFGLKIRHHGYAGDNIRMPDAFMQNKNTRSPHKYNAGLEFP